MWDPIARLSACLFWLLFPALVLAQGDSSANDAAISLPEALTRTVARNPALVAFGYHIAAAEGRLLQAGLAPNLELDVVVQDALGTDAFSGIKSAETTVSLGWILERGVREWRVDAASADLSLSKVDAAIVRLDTVAETARRFLDCLAYQMRLLRADEAVRIAEQTVAAVRSRVAASRALQAELSRAEADLARAELLYEHDEHELLSAYHRLSAQWGETEPDFSSVTGEVQTLPSVEPLETLLARAVQNPELGRMMSQQRLAEAQLHLAEARRKPSWRVYGGLRRYESFNDFAFVGGITVPLTRRNRNQGRIAEAQANFVRTEAETAALRIDVETALFVLYQELLHNTQLADGLRRNVIPRVEQALVDTRRAYELGRYSYLEWSVVQAELLEANNELLEASIDAHRIVIEIERLTGVPIALPTAAQ